MEFYFSNLGISNSFLKCFNSQRDGILRFHTISSQAKPPVSIPNGMEFYRKQVKRPMSERAFQFPTGWNSTHLAAVELEFVRAFQFPTGWNSTIRRQTPCFPSLVSIPNGMEFYKQQNYLFPAFSLSFNSQRDGILLRLPLMKMMPIGFQFPTGWNSTLGIGRGGSFIGLFQFPTGWNSTP